MSSQGDSSEMSRYVATTLGNEITVHLPPIGGSYDTLCGIGTDDEACDMPQEISVPTKAKVNCFNCIETWKKCKQFSKSDLE